METRPIQAKRFATPRIFLTTLFSRQLVLSSSFYRPFNYRIDIVKNRKSSQSGFTLVEIAIVLVIIGLLLAGVFKGQELIVSARVGALANEIKAVSAAYYAYQDRYRAIPGDDSAAVARLGAAVNGVNVINAGAAADGLIGSGTWIGAAAPAAGNQSSLFWNHTRAAGLLTGSGAAGNSPNAAGGVLGVTSTRVMATILNNGTTFICSSGFEGRIAGFLDARLDDGVSTTGAMQGAVGTPVAAGTASAANYLLAGSYTVCIPL